MSKREDVICSIMLTVVIAFSVMNNLIWLWIDTRPPKWDEAYYLTLSLKYHENLVSSGVRAFIGSLLTLDPTRPPLVPALAVPAYILLGKSPDTAIAVNLVAFGLLILAVYGMGARLASSRSGLLAAIFVSTYPGTLALSRMFLFDFVNAALVAASLYLLVRTEAFSRSRSSLALGAAMGLGLLCRPFFPVFMIGPLGISAYVAWRESRLNVSSGGTERPRSWANGGLALLVCVAVAAPWYIINLAPVIQRSLSAALGARAVDYGTSNPLTIHALLRFLIKITSLTPFGTVLFLFAATILWVKRSCLIPRAVMGKLTPSQGFFILLFSVLVPLLFFSTLRNQDLKNLLPIYPGMAVITAWGLSLPQGVGTQPRSGEPVLLMFRAASSNPEAFLSLPRRENWNIPEILSRMTGGSVRRNGVRIMARPGVVAVVPDHPLFNRNNLGYFAALNGLPIQVERVGDPRDPGGKDYRTQLLGVDFAVIKTGDPGPAWLNRNNVELMEFLRSPESGLVEVSPRFPLPDGSEAILYAVPGEPFAGGPSQVRVRAPVIFGDQVELLGYDLEGKGSTARGRAFLVTYYWKALREIANDYQVFVHITEGVGSKWVMGWDHAPARGRYPTSFWAPGSVIRDRGLYFLPGDLRGGLYLMRVGLYLLATGERLKVVHAAPGITVDDQQTRAAIGTVQIK
jgi:4-amino-4-deoxy-L-arabinose transferase-like glycosyltransferase